MHSFHYLNLNKLTRFGGFFVIRYNARMPRLYDSTRWKALRLHQLAANPLCAYCQARGIINAASIVDHIVPHRNNVELFFSSDNLQSLCKHCHDSHKQRLEKSGKILGADISGAPINKSSHWHCS